MVYLPTEMSVFAVGEINQRERLCSCYLCYPTTAILIIIEGHETASNGFFVPVYYWKTVEKPETDTQLL